MLLWLLVEQIRFVLVVLYLFWVVGLLSLLEHYDQHLYWHLNWVLLEVGCLSQVNLNEAIFEVNLMKNLKVWLVIWSPLQEIL